VNRAELVELQAGLVSVLRATAAMAQAVGKAIEETDHPLLIVPEVRTSMPEVRTEMPEVEAPPSRLAQPVVLEVAVCEKCQRRFAYLPGRGQPPARCSDCSSVPPAGVA
jgi:hypothetical protein